MAQLMVDSWSPITRILAHGETLGEFVARTLRPNIWGRYLPGGQAPGLTTAEIAAAHALCISVTPIYSPSHLAEGIRGGRIDALAAAAAAGRLAMGCCTVWADVESGTPLDPAWVKSWTGVFRAHPQFFAGIYCSAMQPPVAAALRTAGEAVAVWVAAWEAQGARDMTIARPQALPTIDVRPATVAAWQYAGDAMGGLLDLSIASDPSGMIAEPARETPHAALASKLLGLAADAADIADELRVLAN